MTLAQQAIEALEYENIQCESVAHDMLKEFNITSTIYRLDTDSYLKPVDVEEFTFKDESVLRITAGFMLKAIK